METFPLCLLLRNIKFIQSNTTQVYFNSNGYTSR